jgi:alkanesulfonate monooxygenase SsuD/methylene tetrahydromethanopterin reductase-like flavin-dependent oxidoreductase (luciferase family)
MSGGRVELGIGTGWYDGEHTAYGIPFPPLGERFERLEEQLQVVRGLWAAEGSFTFDGKHYQLVDSPALPKPAQRPGPPIVMGGFGAKRTPRLAATYADEYNVPMHPFDETVAAFGRVREACARTGREVLLSAAQTIAVGKDDAEVRRRAEAIGQDPDRLRDGGLCGTPAEVVDKIGRFAEAGAARVYLQTMDLHDLDHLELVASEVLPQV